MNGGMVIGTPSRLVLLPPPSGGFPTSLIPSPLWLGIARVVQEASPRFAAPREQLRLSKYTEAWRSASSPPLSTKIPLHEPILPFPPDAHYLGDYIGALEKVFCRTRSLGVRGERKADRPPPTLATGWVEYAKPQRVCHPS